MRYLYSRWIRNSFIYLLILVAVIAIVFAFFSSGPDHPNVPFGEVIDDAQKNEVQKIEVDGSSLEVTYANETNGEPDVKSSKMGSNTDLEQLLSREVEPTS